jgi:hypothetical protein
MARIGIFAPPGARCGFLATFLNQKLTKDAYDVGRELNYASGKLDFVKTHVYDKNIYKNDITVRINLSYDSIDQMLFLFLHKNIYRWEPNFTKDEYSIETFTKLYRQAISEIKQEKFLKDSNIKFDIEMEFKNTFNVGYIFELYKSINGKLPSTKERKNAILSMSKSSPYIPINHASNIVKLIINKETKLNLNELNRKWDINNIFQNTDTKKLYNTVNNIIKGSNYF